MLPYSSDPHRLCAEELKKSIKNAFIANKEKDRGEIQKSILKLHALPQHFQLSGEAVLTWDW